MSTVVLLDSGPLGLLTNPTRSNNAIRCEVWAAALTVRGVEIAVPEIIYYELRRELVLNRKTIGLQRLDAFIATATYLSLSKPIMTLASEMWAQVRQAGKATTDKIGIDIDVILAAQAAAMTGHGYRTVIATTNVRHLALFGDARQWDTADGWADVV